jgi:hypothetical protein
VVSPKRPTDAKDWLRICYDKSIKASTCEDAEGVGSHAHRLGVQLLGVWRDSACRLRPIFEGVRNALDAGTPRRSEATGVPGTNAFRTRPANAGAGWTAVCGGQESVGGALT